MKIFKGLIPVFDGPNGSITFPEWKSFILVTLRAEHLSDVLRPWSPHPMDLAIVEANRIDDERQKLQEEAMAIIYNGLSSHQRLLVGYHDDSTPLAIWNSLIVLYGATSVAQGQALNVNFNTTKMLETETVSTYVSRLRVLTNQLHAADIIISDDNFMAKLIGDMQQHSYYTVPLLAFSARQEEHKTMADLLQWFLTYEIQSPRQSPVSSTSDANQRALQASSTSSHRTSSPTTCQWCQKSGHSAAECYTLQRSRSANSSSPSSSSKPASTSNQPKKKTRVWCAYHKNSSHNSAECAKLTSKKKGTDTSAVANNQGFHAVAKLASESTAVHRVILDSGSTVHMCSDLSLFQNYIPAAETISISWGNNSVDHARGSGKISFSYQLHGTTYVGFFKDVLHVPALGTQTLISLAAMEKNGKRLSSPSPGVIHVGSDDNFITARQIDNLYVLDVVLLSADTPPIDTTTAQPSAVSSSDQHAALTSTSLPSEVDLWHFRFGHLSMPVISAAVAPLGIKLPSTLTTFCETCPLAKQTRPSFKIRSTRSSQPLQLVHTDLCGPFPSSLCNKKYFITFVDDFTRFTTVYFLESKHQAFKAFQNYHAAVTNLHCLSIKALQSDNGGEFVNERFNKFCSSLGIERRLATPYSPQSNGIAERMNRTLLELTRSFLLASPHPETFWAEAVAAACHVRNSVFTNTSTGSLQPFTLWYGTSPPISNLRVWGCPVYTKITKPGLSKLAPRSQLGFFIGYTNSLTSYRVWDPVTQRVVISRDIVFDEQHLLTSAMSSSIPANPLLTPVWRPFDPPPAESDDEDDIPILQTLKNIPFEPIAPVAPAPRRQAPLIFTPSRNSTSIQTAVAMNSSNAAIIQPDAIFSSIPIGSKIKIPSTIREAFASPQRILWQEAIFKELQNLSSHATWTLVDPPEGVRPLACRWVFSVKYSPDGSISELKARLVIKGFMQQEGVDYSLVESPVASLDTVRSLLAYAASESLIIGQLDISGAFLNGELEEEIYMQQPPGYIDSERPHAVCKLGKALYGLKQAALAWFTTFVAYLLSRGFQASHADPCLFIRGTRSSKQFITLTIWVDDILAVAPNRKIISDFWTHLNSTFKAKDMGSPNLFIGIHVQQSPTTYAVTLDQGHYIKELITLYGITNTTPLSTPFNRGQLMDSNPSSVPFKDKTKYQSLVGALLWVCRCTRPDIAFAVSYLGRSSHAPTIVHWGVALQTLRYLHSTINLALQYTSGPSTLTGYTDSDFAEDYTTRKSTSGQVFFLRPTDSPISWRSKLQSLVTRSSTEAEYVACSDAAQEATWLGYLFESLGLSFFPIPLSVDNASARTLTSSTMLKQRTKHIDIRYHYCKDRNLSGFINILPVSGVDNPADIFTKIFAPTAFSRATRPLNLISLLS